MSTEKTQTCPHEDDITYLDLVQIDGQPQYIVKCETCGKLGIIYLGEGDEDWNSLKNQKNYIPESKKTMNKQLIKNIKDWIKDYEKSFEMTKCCDYGDDSTFEGSAYNLLSQALNELTNN